MRFFFFFRKEDSKNSENLIMKKLILLAAFSFTLIFTGCKSVPRQEPVNPTEKDDFELIEEFDIEPEHEVEIEPEIEFYPKATISRNLSDEPVLSAEELYFYFMSQNPEADRGFIIRMANYYIEECAAEGINSDCAFAQMCLETGYLRFGNLVTPDMHNYCGLGAIDEDRRGEVFETEQLGVRAHIQHLFAYAKTEENQLTNELIDKRFKWVNPKGKAPTIFELAGTWAADRDYGTKLDAILTKMELSTTIE